LAYFAKHFIILIEFFYINYTTNLLKILFPKKTKSPLAKDQRARIVKLPLLETFRTFKEDMAIENIRLNQLILQC